MKDINASISLGHFCGDVCLYYWKFCLLNETMFPDMVLLSVLRSRALSRCYHEGPKSSLSDCKNFLNQFEGGSVDLIKSGSVAHLILNHPERRNAMSGVMMVQLLEKVEELESWQEGVGLVVRGQSNNSKVFCSGGDLKTVEGMPSTGGFTMATLMSEATTRLRQLPLVSVSVLEGAAVGGGAELTTCTDFRLATAKASISFVQVKMGVAPGWGGASRLVDIVGKRKALQLMLSCQKVGLQEGLDCCLFDAELDETEPVAAAEKWLENLVVTDRAAEVVRTIKNMVVGDPEEEARHFAPLWGREANKTALSKQLKHR